MDVKQDSIVENILDEYIDAAILIPTKIDEYLNKNIPIELKLFFRSGKGENLKQKRLTNILNEYFIPIETQRYTNLNLKKEIFEKYNISEIDVASEQEKFGKTIGTFLPYMFLLFCFAGAMYPALDLGAGEKERGTLETILTSPASQIQILTGKFLVVSFFGIMSVAFGLIGMLIAVSLK